MEEEQGLSLLDIFKIIFFNKTLFVILFGICSITTICLIVLYNRNMPTHSIEFDYRWYGIDENIYANSEAFNYFDIISLENIKEVKESKEEYNNLNSYLIYDNISIDNNENSYSLIADVSIFRDDKEGKAFIYDLIYKPFLYAKNLDFKFNSNLVAYSDSKRLYTKLDYLDSQITLLIKGYNELITYFGDLKIDNKNLSLLLEEIEVFSVNRPISQYRYLTYKNTYMTEDEYLNSKSDLESLIIEKNILNNRKQVLLESIEKIYTSSNNNSYIDSALSGYLNSLHELDVRLIKINENTLLINDAINGKYNKIESNLFISELDEYRDKLRDFTNIYDNVVKEVLSKNTFINVYKYEIKGKINSILGVVISLGIGLFLSFFVCFCINYWKFINNDQKMSKIDVRKY